MSGYIVNSKNDYVARNVLRRVYYK